MSNNLTKIKNMLASLKNDLVTLRQQPGDIDNPEKAINERRDLEDKILFYEDQEKIESERIVKEQSKAKAQQRKNLLLDIAAKSEAAKNKHVELTKRASDLISDLAGVLIEREQVFTNADTGLNNPDLYDLLTTDERSYLSKQMERSVQGIYSGIFSATFREAVSKQCEGVNEKIRYGLFDLVYPPQDFHKPIKGANSMLSNAARKMSQVAYPESESSTPYEAVKPEPEPGFKGEADLRPSAKQKKKKSTIHTPVLLRLYN